jgi:undecaprenyl-diphosphatase
LKQRTASLIIVALCAIAYVLLGNAVSHVPPAGIDLAGSALTGQAPQLATVLTASCFFPVLAVFDLLAIALAFRSKAWRSRALFFAILLPIAWKTSDALKNVFERPRPDYWIVYHETSFSYSSGHAMFAILVYGLWASFIFRSNLQPGFKYIAAPLLGLWAAGILWSRLALGAHYVSDILGGILLGVALVALGNAIYRQVLKLKVS